VSDLDVSTVNNLTLPGRDYVPANAEATRTDGSHVSQDAFLRLLVAQLQNQDPLEPAQNTEFIAQLAQFQSLEGQLKSNDTLSRIASVQESQLALQGLAQAATLIGADVEWTDPYDGARYHGVIDRISVDDGITVAHIGDARVPLGMLTSVSRAAPAPTTPPSASSASTATSSKTPSSSFNDSAKPTSASANATDSSA
jgi:flagellar basal-body rod modification protein FlgD